MSCDDLYCLNIMRTFSFTRRTELIPLESTRDCNYAQNALFNVVTLYVSADFGFARYVVDPETKQRQLSETYCGSAAYAAPEVGT